MSMQTYINYGYGFSVPAVQKDTWKKFIANHEEAILKHSQGTELIDYMNESGDDFDPETEFEDWDESGNLGFSGIIATVMSEETGIRFGWFPAQEGDTDYIMMTETMPWNFNEFEKTLTAEKFDLITLKYRKELWETDSRIPDIPGCDYQRQEYFG